MALLSIWNGPGGAIGAMKILITRVVQDLCTISLTCKPQEPFLPVKPGLVRIGEDRRGWDGIWPGLVRRGWDMANSPFMGVGSPSMAP